MSRPLLAAVGATLVAGAVACSGSSAPPTAQPTQSTAVPTPSSTPPAPPAEATLAFAGDTHFVGASARALDGFGPIAAYLQRADLAMVNLESAVTLGGTAVDKEFVFRSPPQSFAALKAAGIDERDIQTSGISLQPRYSDPERDAQMLSRTTGRPYVPPTEAPKIIGYEARNSVQVRVRKLGEMGKIIDTLIGEGANQVDGPNFTLDEPREALDEARSEAVAVGRQRAELYAKATGMRVEGFFLFFGPTGYYPVQQAIVVTGSRIG